MLFILGVTSDVTKSFGRIWRFAPMADIFVDEFHSRDLDSNFTAREVSAVNDWLSTNYTFHVMRDHIHHTFPIQAGMFGNFCSTVLKERTTLTLSFTVFFRCEDDY